MSGSHESDEAQADVIVRADALLAGFPTRGEYREMVRELRDALEELRARWRALGHSSTQRLLLCEFVVRRRDDGGDGAYCLVHATFHDRVG